MIEVLESEKIKQSKQLKNPLSISFENYETKNTINFCCTKPFVLIYGKNGSGKTTFSRHESFDTKFVFNEDFIYENVYNIDNTGANQTVKTKENFSGLWLGEKIVSIRKEITVLINIEKEFKDTYNKEIKTINDYLLKNQIIIDLDAKISQLADKTFILDVDNYKSQLSAYSCNFNYENNISDRDDFKSKLQYLNKNDLYNLLLSKIKSSDLLSNIILNMDNKYLENINTTLKFLNDGLQIINSVETIYKEEDITPDLAVKIKEWYHIHKDRETCLFCGNINIAKAIEKWKTVFTNEFVKEKDKLIDLISKDIQYCESIINEKVRFMEVDEAIISCIDSIMNELKKYQENINKNIFQQIILKFDMPKKEFLDRMILIENLGNFTLEQKKNIFGFYSNSLVWLNNEKKKLLDLTDNMMNESGEITAKKINNIFERLGLNKSITISVDKHSTPHKFVYSVQNHKNLNELSDGQKHKLALAIFLNSLEENDLNNQTIIIDDPVVSLDIMSYILFKNYLKSLTTSFSPSTRLILLTHDISYLYLQLSNVFEDEKMKNITEIFKINGSGIKPIPLDLLKTDDITLFHMALDTISTLEELAILNSIINKIFRIILDLRLRFYGISITDGIGINLLPITDLKKETIKEASNHIMKTSRNQKALATDILASLKYLRDICNILGILNFIDDSKIANVEKVINNNLSGDSKNIVFEIIETVSNFLKTSINDDLRNYVEHTRNSYTRNLIGLDLDDTFN